MKEATIRAVLIGIFVGIIFGAANAYVGLRVGMTVSASIPAAIVGMALLKLAKKGHILEGNIIQTVGSAGESLAAGVIFTLPALYVWGEDPGMLRITLISMLAGGLGVLLMVPLRDYLVRIEDQSLPFPEGRACAKVLEAGQGQAGQAKLIFIGFFVGLAYQFFINGKTLGLWPGFIAINLPFVPSAQISADLTPELLAVGFLVGPSVANAMVSGGALGWLVLIPLIAFFGSHVHTAFFPETTIPLSHMTPDEIWNKYIRYIGAGTITIGGIIALIKATPALYRSLKDSIKGIYTKSTHKNDLSLSTVLLGTIGIGITLALLPRNFIPLGFIGAILVIVFAFIFVAVSARIVGIVGSSNNPVSGMTIATLIGVTTILVASGQGGNNIRVEALIIGAIVCIAAAIAADTSQDLKTGYILGATPWKQQIGEIVGVLTSSLTIAWVLYILHASYHIGSKELPAPQANLMAVVIDGITGGNLPWVLVFIGAILATITWLLNINIMAFAIGMYLPFSLSVPIFIGGIARFLIKQQGASERQLETGTLFSSGLIAGSALCGVLIALLVFLSQFFGSVDSALITIQSAPKLDSSLFSLIVFLGLAVYLYILSKSRNNQENNH
ncbi:MAG TPA: oligopeptide transporter, OPT family [Nitrospiraceae bacterium]|nr:oligopeptide transporter, OPT family [Nitrospiraceae bacterium]